MGKAPRSKMLFTIRLAINFSHSQESTFLQFLEHSLGRDTDNRLVSLGQGVGEPSAVSACEAHICL